MKKILILNVGRRVELVQAFRDAALIYGKEVIIYGEDTNDTAPAFVFCDKRFRAYRIKDKRYISGLLKEAIKERIDLIIPTIDTNLLLLAQNREKFEAKGIKVLISSLEMVSICRDKNKTYHFFDKCCLEVPKTVNKLEDYKGPYPCIIKPKDGSSSINVCKAENRKELIAYAEKMEGYIIQPFIDGEEYTVDIFCDFAGNPVYITPRKRLAVRAGEVLKAAICMDRQIINECMRLIGEFRPCGPITVQLIRDRNHTDWFIEINPRFGGGAPLSMRAGAKTAQTLLKLLDGENEYVMPAEDGVVYSRFDQGVCFRKSCPAFAKGVIFDLDDTLYPEKEYIKSGYRAVAEYLGEVGAVDELWEYFENGKLAIDELLKRIGREDEIHECVKIYRRHKPILHLYDCVEELINDLKKNNIRVGIITDGRPDGQRNKIEALGLDQLDGLDIIITDELGGIQFRKPCDIAFRIMGRRWKIPYENIVYIGDNASKDFQAPRQLGISAIWFRNADGLYQGSFLEDIFTIDSIEQVREVILGRKP